MLNASLYVRWLHFFKCRGRKKMTFEKFIDCSVLIIKFFLQAFDDANRFAILSKLKFIRFFKLIILQLSFVQCNNMYLIFCELSNPFTIVLFSIAPFSSPAWDPYLYKMGRRQLKDVDVFINHLKWGIKINVIWVK